ncbi:hypothetical protein BSKO_11624 [Bryopsis sp. KO-2023]|nr:hypothetical protein BSKO_11624 [Bryopsis sp. KO-2023]
MAQWKGLRVEVPGKIFYEPDKTWLGTVTGVVQAGSSTKRKSVYVEFDDDEEKYWFKMADVVEWIVDREKAELLRPTIHSTPKRKSKTKSPSMEPSFSARSDADEPAPARSPVREEHSQGDKVQPAPEAEVFESNEKSGGSGMLPLPPPLPPIDEALRSAESPSGSVVGKFSSWVSKKLRPAKVGEGVAGIEDKKGEGLEDMEVADKGFETDEEVLDDNDLDRISGGTPIMPERSGGRGWMGKVKEVFYTPLPFTPMSFRRARLSPHEESSAREEAEEDVKDIVGAGLRRGSGSEERHVLFPVHGFRMLNNPPSDDDAEPAPKQEAPGEVSSSGYGTRVYRAFKSLFSRQPRDDDYPAGDPSPSMFRHRRHKFVPSEVEVAESSVESEDLIVGDGGSAVGGRGEKVSAKWQPMHVLSSVVIMAAWGFCVYSRYFQIEEVEQE